MRIFPIPTFDKKLFFTYIKKSEKNALTRTTGTGSLSPGGSNLITNISNVPYHTITYNHINDVFKKWIFDYALAICKETLGNIRALYNTIPVPGAEVTINGQALIDQANNEKTALIEQLRGTLDDTSRQKQLEKKNQESQMMRETFVNFPLPIFIA